MRRLSSADCSRATPTDGVDVPLAASQATVTDSGLSLGTPYCYRAFWYDASGHYSPQTSALPSYAGSGPGVGSLGAASIGQTTVTFTHTVPSSSLYASALLLRRQTADCSTGTGGTAVPIGSTATTVDDSGLAPGATYCYSITWYDAFGNGSTSFVNNVTTLKPNCARTAGHAGYYRYGAVGLVYTCDVAVASVSPAGMPAFLSTSIIGNQVHFDGTASTTGNTTWSFTINGGLTGGDAAAITTRVISETTLVATTLASHVFSTAESGTPVDLAFQLGLDPSYDGSAVDLSLGALTSDIPLLSLTCSGPSQLCAGSGTISGGVFHKPLELQWRFSAYDQGSYYVTFTPHAIIEGHDYPLAAVSAAVTVPMQTIDGNATLSTLRNPGDPSGNDPIMSFSLAIGTSSSTPLLPVLGLVYSNLQATSPYYFETVKKLVVDRTDDPTSNATTGVTESNNTDLSSSWTRGGHLRALADGSWAALSSVNSGGFGMRYQHIATTTNTPASGAPVSLNSVSGAVGEVVDMDLTDPFDDGGTTRLAYAFTVGDFYGDRHCHVDVAKLNPAGTSQATVSDDSHFDANATHPAILDYAGSNGGECDRPKIRYLFRDSTHKFLYVAYRSTSNLVVTRIDADFATSYNMVTPATIGGVLGAGIGSATSGGQPGTHDVAVATIGGVGSLGVVYLDTTNSNKCYFRRYAEDLSSATLPLQISSVSCREPRLAYNPASGRFIVTYVSNNYDVATSEITVGSPDSASTSIDVLHTNQTSSPINKLATAFYPAGNWMGLVYHIATDTLLKVHGYHVSDQ